MEITIDELKTYIHCPAQYQFRHKMNVPEDTPENIAYSKALHRTIHYFYYSVLGGFVPSPKQMKDKWAKIWNEEQDIHFDFTRDFLTEHIAENTARQRTHEEQMKKKTIQGFELIHNFHHFNKNNVGIPIAVDHEFKVPIGPVTVVGNFELIREVEDERDGKKYVEIVDFKTGPDNRGDFLKDNDLIMTIMSYAFRNLFQSSEDRLVYNHIKTGKQSYTYRNDNDYKRMEAIVTSVAEGILAKNYIPRETFMCRACPFQDECDAIQF